jgi:anti-sigma B factor antagonist
VDSLEPVVRELDAPAGARFTLEPHPSDPAVRRIVVDGDVDVSSAGRLGAVLDQALAESPSVVVDMSGALFIDSTGLAVLLNAMRRATRRQGAVAVVCPNRTPLRAFEITKTVETLNVSATDEQALAAVHRWGAVMRRSATPAD